MATKIYTEKLRIKDAASILGVTRRTLRFYEEIGLIHPQKEANGTRLYGEDDLDRLRFILRLKAVGLGLKEIQDLAVLNNGEKEFSKLVPKVIEALDFHDEKILRRLRSLKGLKEELLGYQRKIKEILFAGHV